MTDRTDEIRQRCEAGRTVRITDVKYLLGEIERLNCKLQDERKEHAKEYSRLRSTYISAEAKLTARAEQAERERDAAVEKIEKLCLKGPSYGISAGKLAVEIATVIDEIRRGPQEAGKVEAK